MVKLVILYKHPTDIDQFEQGYAENLAKLEALPGIVRRQANVILGSPTQNREYYRVLELYFDNFMAMDRAMTSPAGTQAGQDLMRYTNGQVELLFMDVFEDDTPPDNAETDLAD